VYLFSKFNTFDRIIEKIQNDPEADNIKNTELKLWHKIRKTCVEGRRTGVGITAEGDMLAALNLVYGTDEGIEFAEKVHQTVALSAYRSSIMMAKERGAVPIFDYEREKRNPFINRLEMADPDLKDELIKHGRRNIALLTIAPTGTTSLMTQTTSGIEPAFLISYKRRRKVNPNDTDVKVTFVDEVGDHWEEYHVFHHKFVDWMRAQGFDIDKGGFAPNNGAFDAEKGRDTMKNGRFTLKKGQINKEIGRIADARAANRVGKA
jgi:ribonucleoside-diphosphate reductase alpha chain